MINTTINAVNEEARFDLSVTVINRYLISHEINSLPYYFPH